MIVLAIFSTLLAIVATVLVFYSNAMNPAPTIDNFQFAWGIWAGWIGSAVMWLAWALDKWA